MPQATQSPDTVSTAPVQRDQALRIRRLGMSFLSYLVTFTLAAFCAWLDLLPWLVALQFLLFAALINCAFLLLFRYNINLRFKDPSMTAIQMVLSLMPALYVMYFVEAGQVRAAFLVIAIVPALYGILALNTRQFMAVGALFLLLYGVLIGALYLWRPTVMNGPLEIVQALAWALVMVELAIIGGFISGLREKLRRRNQELNQALIKISEMANRDPLTGLSNRRHLFEVLTREIKRHHRTGGTFSVCVMDVDHFKAINDRHGHHYGDLVLQRIADTVTQNLRDVFDHIGRYGGEEFLLILPQTPLEGAITKAERVRKLIADIRYPEIDENFQVNVSIGVAEYRAPEDIDETIKRADQALYRAKSMGRNQCLAEAATVTKLSAR